jgi:WD40 repeat protein
VYAGILSDRLKAVPSVLRPVPIATQANQICRLLSCTSHAIIFWVWEYQSLQAWWTTTACLMVFNGCKCISVNCIRFDECQGCASHALPFLTAHFCVCSPEQISPASLTNAFACATSPNPHRFSWDSISQLMPRITYHSGLVFSRPCQLVEEALMQLLCTPGHTEAVLSVHFSPDGRQLVTGSGDSTVRFWDLQTQLPKKDGKVHTTWVMAVAWAPDGVSLVSGDKEGLLHVWDPETATSRGVCRGHTKWITAIAWQPAHLSLPCARCVSASKDCTARVWSTETRAQLLCLGGHTATVNAVKWTGDDCIITASNDREIRVWNGRDGRTIRVLVGHAHRVNSLALSSEFVLRTGAFDHTGKRIQDYQEAKLVC